MEVSDTTEYIKMDIDSKKRKMDTDTTEKIEMDIDSKKIRIDINSGDIK
ncbi:16931_t:CDS:1, partial [Racocetra persica]